MLTPSMSKHIKGVGIIEEDTMKKKMKWVFQMQWISMVD